MNLKLKVELRKFSNENVCFEIVILDEWLNDSIGVGNVRLD